MNVHGCIRASSTASANSLVLDFGSVASMSRVVGSAMELAWKPPAMNVTALWPSGVSRAAIGAASVSANLLTNR